MAEPDLQAMLDDANERLSEVMIEYSGEIRRLQGLVDRWREVADELMEWVDRIACECEGRCECGLEQAVANWEDLSCEHEGEMHVLIAERWQELADRLYEAIGRCPDARVSVEGRAAMLAYEQAVR